MGLPQKHLRFLRDSDTRATHFQSTLHFLLLLYTGLEPSNQLFNICPALSSDLGGILALLRVPL